MSNLMSNYSPLDVTFVKGEGCWLTDSKGDEYLDALSGIGVVNLGHCHPTVTKNLVDQSQKLLHTSNVYRIDNQEKLKKSNKIKVLTVSTLIAEAINRIRNNKSISQLFS